MEANQGGFHLAPSAPKAVGPPQGSSGASAHPVEIDLQQNVPHGWLHVGTRDQVPGDAGHAAHSGRNSVWVEPDGFTGLSRFTLVVLAVTKPARSSASPGAASAPEGH